MRGHCLVLPITTKPQTGLGASWAYELQTQPLGRRSWVVCNHLYTVSTTRLAPPGTRVIPRLPEAEFEAILFVVARWLPALPQQGAGA